MRVVCDNCKTKYSIGDDKVRGKVFKIRCKKCQHVIVVKGGEGAEAASAVAAVAAAGGGGGGGAAMAQAGQAPYEEKETRVFDYAGAGFDTGSAAEGAPAAEEAPNNAVWHLVVEGEQVGPFSDADVVLKIQAGEVGAETFAWRDGFGDWQRIKEITDFSEAISAMPPTDVAHQPMFGAMAAQAAESAQRPSTNTPAPNAQAAATPIQARTPAPVAATTSRAAAKSPGESLFEDDPAPAQPQLTATRNENSVLFSLSDLAGRATSAAAAARSSSALPLSGTDSSGLADIRSMAAAVPKDKDDDDLVSALGRFSAGPASPVLLAPVGSSYPKWLLPVALGGGLLLLLLVGTLSYVVFFKQSSAPVATAETQAPPSVVPAPVAPSPAAPAPSPTDPLKTSSTESVVQPAPAVPPSGPSGVDSRPAATSKKSTKGEPRSSGSAGTASSEPKASKPSSSKGGGDELDQLLSGAIQGGGNFNRPKAAAPSAAAAADSNLPEQLNRSQIQKGMGGVKAKVGGCFDQYHVPGVVSVRVVVGGTGRVSVATVTGQFAGTPTGTCVEKAVKGARFDQFSGPSQSIDYPYVLPIR